MAKKDFKASELLAEAISRKTIKFDLSSFCFDKQLEFINLPNSYATALCGRRSGKTTSCAAHLIATAISRPRSVCLYITLSRTNARKIIWPELVEIDRKHDLGAKINGTELSLKFPNGSTIYLSGAKDQSEIEKFRGLALTLVYIDEAQSFGHYIESLVEEVISKALYDNNGKLRLIGTPGPIPAGYFYDACQSNKWGHSHWTMFDNPHILIKSRRTPQDLLAEDLDRTGLSADAPRIQREVFARFVMDSNALVFRYNPLVNHYDELPASKLPWQFVFGVDLGHDDADAIAVIGWNDKLEAAYLVEELVAPKQGITELVGQLRTLIDKYDPMKIVMDTGGLGKKIAEEIRRRHSIPIEAAEKTRKNEFIEILNDSLRTKRFMAKRTSRFSEDSTKVEWDRDGKTSKSGKLQVSDRFHSDITDAVLYGYREALNWLFIPEKRTFKERSPEWWQELEDQMEAQAEARYQAEKEENDEEM